MRREGFRGLSKKPSTRTTSWGLTVAQYLVNPDGFVDGLLLSNNTIIRFPPHLGQVLGTLFGSDCSRGTRLFCLANARNETGGRAWFYLPANQHSGSEAWMRMIIR
jgi:hypothetical protein